MAAEDVDHLAAAVGAQLIANGRIVQAISLDRGRPVGATAEGD